MKDRRNFIKQSALATTALLVPKPFLSIGKEIADITHSGSNGNSITLLHTNDLHNNLEAFSYKNYGRSGGFENCSGIISRIKEDNANVLLVDAGDIFCGSIFQQKAYETTLQQMSIAGYDAALPGNRDYEGGIDFLHQHMNTNSIPLVTSNYLFKDSRLKNMHEPYRIIHKGGIKIGIIGAGLDMTGLVPTEVNNSIQYNEPVKILTAVATMLREEKKCQLVVCLSHLGYQNNRSIDDRKLAAQSKNIDVIIGGHSHTFLRSPQIVLNQDNTEVIINHAGYGGMMLGNMNISFDGNGKKNHVTFENLLVGADDNKWTHKKYASLRA